MPGIAPRDAGSSAPKRPVADGETSAVMVSRPGVRTSRVGVEIAPGVPWTFAAGAAPIGGLHSAPKSGTFGAPDSSQEAFRCLA